MCMCHCRVLRRMLVAVASQFWQVTHCGSVGSGIVPAERDLPNSRRQDRRLNSCRGVAARRASRGSAPLQQSSGGEATEFPHWTSARRPHQDRNSSRPGVANQACASAVLAGRTATRRHGNSSGPTRNPERSSPSMTSASLVGGASCLDSCLT